MSKTEIKIPIFNGNMPIEADAAEHFMLWNFYEQFYLCIMSSDEMYHAYWDLVRSNKHGANMLKLFNALDETYWHGEVKGNYSEKMSDS